MAEKENEVQITEQENEVEITQESTDNPEKIKEETKKGRDQEKVNDLEKEKDRKRSESKKRSRKRSRSRSKSRSRRSKRSRSRHRIRSYRRSRSRSRDRRYRSRDRSRERNRDRNREKSRERSRERKKRRSRSRSHTKRRSGSRSPAKNGESKRKSPSPEKKKEEAKPKVIPRVPPIGSGPQNLALRAKGLLNVPQDMQLRISDLLSRAQLLTQSTLANGAATKNQREVYVGNLPPGVTIHQIIEYVNVAMVALGNVTNVGNPVVNGWLAGDANYGFVEFRSIEEATNSLAFQGSLMLGYCLRFGRPKNYTGNVFSVPFSLASSVNALHAFCIMHPVDFQDDFLVAFNIPQSLTADQVREFVSAFGELKYFELPTDAMGVSFTYAIFAYTEKSATELAIKTIPEQVIGASNIIIQNAKYAQDSSKRMNLAVAASALGVQTVANTSMNVAGLTSIGMAALPGLANTLGLPLTQTQLPLPTRVLALSNIVSAQELEDDEEFEDIKLDIEQECSNYGNISEVYIPRPNGPESEQKAVGTVFVKYESIESSQIAQQALSGKKFGENVVQTIFFSDENFDSRNFSAV